ncbi:MAG: hypothetical protein A3H32_07710 [Betaproteobacteria bacterium RIFCSPLOWO2_02_FULL_63_19]|nr:MAG: hypothetical protein A3H32_07710 [Betaproteobacteria bacterium RIFCSPLOWO2_02_FULL_63_19]
MPSLHELQARFAAALNDAKQTQPATRLFSGPRAMTLARLAIYRGNVHGNRANALAGAYPIARKIVGDEFFDAMAREYARGHRSRCGDLNEYGEYFPDFVAAFPHTADLPYLPDVVRMEWLAHRAYYAADPAPFDASALAGLPTERYGGLRPRLAGGCALLESAWPLGRIWTLHQDDYGGAFEIDLDAGPDRVLIHRPAWRVQVCSLAPGDFRFLESASCGATLDDAFEAAAAADADFDLSRALTRWIDARVIENLV